MKNYTELFLGLILAGVALITLGFVLITTPGAFGSRATEFSTVVADRANR